MTDHTFQIIAPTDLALRCFHEAGHAAATYQVGGHVVLIDTNTGIPHLPAKTTAQRPEEGKHVIAAAGFAIEYLLFKQQRLVDGSGAPLSEKAFINQAFDNAIEDKIAFFGEDCALPDGTWPEEIDRYFMNFAIQKVAPTLERLFPAIEKLANALGISRRVNREKIEEILLTVDVRQRAYAFGKRDSTSVRLQTGNIGSCYVLYGKDEKNGVIFLSHFDTVLCVFGLPAIINDLRVAGCDLKNFKLYVSSGVWPWPFAIPPATGLFLAMFPERCPSLAPWERYLAAGALIGFGIIFLGTGLFLYLAWLLLWCRTRRFPKFRWYRTANPTKTAEVIVDSRPDVEPVEQLERAPEKSRWTALAGRWFGLRKADRSAILSPASEQD
jgi:hypothetical protein